MGDPPMEISSALLAFVCLMLILEGPMLQSILLQLLLCVGSRRPSYA
jgi:hypothetical protein